MYRIGIDIGSTTAKMVVLDEKSAMVFHKYERHQAKVRECLTEFFNELGEQTGPQAPVKLYITGSVGMGLAEGYSIPFVQEVVAATTFISKNYPGTKTMIDIGGEDAKVVFFNEGEATDLRMNGNCAGGTGAFIDQMAILLGVSVDELNELALNAKQIHPIASRCGVFCKTDIQNLIAKNIPREDIAASIFHAVVLQTILTLAHGCDIEAPLLLCGGPLTFIPALRNAFAKYLKLPQEEMVLPPNGNLIPAWGSALMEDGMQTTPEGIIRMLGGKGVQAVKGRLDPIFNSEEEHNRWKEELGRNNVGRKPLQSGLQYATLGIDSGSTTTKIVLLNPEGEILFSYYNNNNGNPVNAVRVGLKELQDECMRTGTDLRIKGCCSTGYGEDLIKAAFRMDAGIIETIAHYMAAKHINGNVSFILDIGGQDMKAIFVNGGVINRIEINEACSSGCGSFISTFAQSLNFAVEDFADSACRGKAPCDLGTRCTVFMNSRVKQVLREGASIEDIAAGLSYSVVKNCLHKVLQLKHIDELGEHIVVQGGTMRNDSIVRSLELLTGKTVFRSDCPELMGALGCALYAQKLLNTCEMKLDDMVDSGKFTSSQSQCHGCENTCSVTRYRFENGNTYFSGNRCEKIFTNKGEGYVKGVNVYERKLEMLFGRVFEVPDPVFTIGIPRSLNTYEEFPFWHTLFTECGINVYLSAPSTYPRYEASANMVMSDNICFPAKVVHSHIQDLIDHHVDRIFMPFVVFEKSDGDQQNSYNCPIVSGYSEIVKNIQNDGVIIDSPAISFKDRESLWLQCSQYLSQFHIPSGTMERAFKNALAEQESFEVILSSYCKSALEEARHKGKMVILLAGRPYHSDPLIQHKVSDMIASMGAYVITDDIIRHQKLKLDDVNYLSQWAFTNRILKAAKWAAQQGRDVQYMQTTSFGCGPDAFLLEEVRSMLMRYGKNLTLLKIDDINNIGSLKLRVRSLIESLKIENPEPDAAESPAGYKVTDKIKDIVVPFIPTPAYKASDKRKKIIVPFFTPFISPLIPSVFKLEGYDMETLPASDSTSCDWGLKYSNNEICYPATLIVGDIVAAFRSGKYDPDDTIVMMTQTGGQCRASNYLSLIKKALKENGYTRTPVLSLAPGSGIENNQKEFHLNWFHILPIALAAILFSDTIAKFYYSSVVREKTPGAADTLRDHYLELAKASILRNKPAEVYALIKSAAADFDSIASDDDHPLPRVGIVGEIFLKFNPFAQKDVTGWLVSKKIEVIPPMLVDFFMQSFVNQRVNKENHLERKSLPKLILSYFYHKVVMQIERVNEFGSGFRYFTPFESIYEKAEGARELISLAAQFGEGWLIAGEISSFSRQNINHVVSLQPFGCIANQIVEKGIEKRLKTVFPKMNILSLDFDSNVSDVNIINRLLLFINNIK